LILLFAPHKLSGAKDRTVDQVTKVRLRGRR